MTNPNTRDIGVNLIVEGLNSWLTSMAKVNSSMASLRGTANNVATSLDAVGNQSMGGTANAVSGVGASAANASGSVNKLGNEFEKTGQKGKEFGEKVKEGAEGASYLAHIAEGAWEQVGGKVAEVLMSTVGKIQEFITGAPQVAGEFNAAILRFSAAAGVFDPKEIQSYKTAFLELGAALPISTQEAVEAATELAKGGVQGNADFIKKMVEEVSKFSLASEMSLTDSAAAYVKIMGTYTASSMPVEERLAFVSKAMDSLTQSAGTSTVGVSDLLDGMLDIGGVTQSIGMSFKDTAMGLGAVAPSFGSTAEAATSFYNMLYRLIPQTNEATDAFYKYGLMTDNYKTIAEAMIRDGLKPQGESVDELKAQYASYLKEVRGLKSGEIDKMFVDMADNAFYANGQMKPLNEIAQILQNSFSGLNNQQRIQALTTIFQTEAMNSAVSLMRLGGEGVNNYANQMNKAMGVQDMFGATFKGQEAAAVNLEGSLESLRLLIGDALDPAMTEFINTQNTAVLSVSAVTSALLGIDGAYQKLTPNQKMVVDGLYDMSEYVTVLYNSFIEYISPLTSLTDDFLTTFNNGLVTTSDYFNDFQSAFIYVFGDGTTGVGAVLKETADIILELLTELFKLIIFLWEANANYVAEYWEEWGGVITAVVKFIYDTVMTTFLAMFSIIADVVNLISALIRGDWTAAFEYGQEIVDTFVTWFTSTFLNLGTTIAIILMKVTQEFGEWVIDVMVFILQLEIQLRKWFNSFMPSWITDLTGGLTIDTQQIVIDMATGWKKGFKSFMDDAMREAQNFANGIIDTLGDIFNFGSPSKTMMKLGRWTVEGYAIGIERSMQDVIEASSKMASAVASPIASTINNITYNNDNAYNLGVTTTASPTQVVRSYDLMRGSI